MMTDSDHVPGTESYSIRVRLADPKTAALFALLQPMGLRPNPDAAYIISHEGGPVDLREEIELEFDLPQDRISCFLALFGSRLTEESRKKREDFLANTMESRFARGEINRTAASAAS